MIIRDIQKNDLVSLTDLYYQFWQERSDIQQMEQEFESIINENRHIILVCEIDGHVIGSVMGVICRELYGNCRPFMVIENMIVDSKYRRCGVGLKLLNELENRAKERNCTQMILVTEKNRADACEFYETYGFSKNTTGYKKKVN